MLGFNYSTSSTFRDVVLFYKNSDIGSYEEYESIHFIADNYRIYFKNGEREICFPYLEEFFNELVNRYNVEHINLIKEMFGGKNTDKSKNTIFQRFVIILTTKIKENENRG